MLKLPDELALLANRLAAPNGKQKASKVKAQETAAAQAEQKKKKKCAILHTICLSPFWQETPVEFECRARWLAATHAATMTLCSCNKTEVILRRQPMGNKGLGKAETWLARHTYFSLMNTSLDSSVWAEIASPYAA